jgi:hypothetical protein
LRKNVVEYVVGSLSDKKNIKLYEKVDASEKQKHVQADQKKGKTQKLPTGVAADNFIIEVTVKLISGCTHGKEKGQEEN